MFGQNKIAKARTIEEGFLVHSIFHTIQGEGPYAGCPAIFVRFAGCNLRCSFCDTEFEEGAIGEMSLGNLLDWLEPMLDDTGCNLIIMTGGEPLLQPVTELCKRLLRRDGDLNIQFETAGTVVPDDFDEIVHSVDIVCSPKTPKIHSLIAHFSWANYKYIIDVTVPRTNKGLPKNVFVPRQDQGAIWVQACDVPNDPVHSRDNMVLAIEIAKHHNYRLSVQTHKIIGVE